MKGKNLKVLAIDNSKSNLALLKAVLLRGVLPGLTLSTALDGAMGLDLAQAEDPDVILLDIVMPGMDGFEVCRRLKSDERLCSIPVLFLTALKADRESRIMALDAGGEGFLSKPFDEYELIAQIKAMAKIKSANQLRRGENEQLEILVVERTRELERELVERGRAEEELLTANKLMKKMIDEGKRQELNLTRSRELLRNLSGRLQSLLEEERTRISREIHDELGQALAGLKMDLSSIKRGLVSEGLADQSAKILEIEQAVSRIIRTVRKIATELRPGILDELGVAAAVEWMAKDFQARTGIRCKVRIQEVDKISDTVRATAIFRILQEALTNVMRHAAASQVDVGLEKKGGALILEVRDNGIGILQGRPPDPKSLGLIGIRERVLLLGGETIIGGKPGEGTLVRVTLPMGSGADSNAQDTGRG